MKCSRCGISDNKIFSPFTEIPYQYGMKSCFLCRKCCNTWYKKHLPYNPYDRKYDIYRDSVIKKFIKEGDKV